MNRTDLARVADDMPKFLGAKGHALMDYLTAGSFFAAGFTMMGRNRRAANFAFFNGASVLLLAMMTDYPGGLWRTLSFQTHGTVDMALAAMVGAGPALMGFASEPEAQFFHGQAVLEGGVIAATDWHDA